MKRQLAIFTASALLMSAAQLSAFTVKAESNVPFWVPESYSETIDFMNAYGNIYVQDDYICFCGNFNEGPGIVKEFQSDDSTAEFEILQDESYSIVDDGWYHSVMVFQAKSSGTLDFTWTEDISIITGDAEDVREVYHFTFSVDENLQITETDLFAFVPDGFDEAQAFAQKNGPVSIQNGYIIFCAECCLDGGYALFLDTEACSVGYEMVYEDMISRRYDESFVFDIDENYVPNGGTVYVVQVLKPIETGYLKVAWRQQRELEEDPIINIEKTFLAYPTVSDITDITETGLTTRVRVVDYYTGEEIPDVTLGLYCVPPVLLACDVVHTPFLEWNTSDEPEYTVNYVDMQLLPENCYVGIVSMPENYCIVDKMLWTLTGQEQVLVEIATNEEIAAGFTLGDANNDGELTTADAVTLQKWLLGTGKLPKWRAADLNGDKMVNGVDLALMKGKLLEYVPVPSEIDVNSLTEEDILALTDDEIIMLYDMLEAGKLEMTTYSYPFPEGFDPNSSTFVAYRYRDEDGNFLYASAETDEEAETFAQEFFVPENDSYAFDGCEKVYADENFWIYLSHYSNQKVADKPYYLIIYNKNYYDMATRQLHFDLNEENLLKFLSIRGISYNLKSFCTETDDQITLSFYSVGYAIAGDWGINDDIEIRKTSIIVDKTTGTFHKSANECVKAVELPGTARDCMDGA